MSLSAWEQQALDSIKDGLAGSDPQLAALLTTFARLASAEEMPVQEAIRAGSRRMLRRALRNPRYRWQYARRRSRPMPGRVKLQWAVLLWLLITVAMITVAVVMSRGGGVQGACTGSLPPVCSHSAPG